MDKNPFELTRKSGGTESPKRPRYGSVWTASEQNDKLYGYLEIKPENWSTIKCGSHIRYVTQDNVFRTGGFIMKNPYTFHIENVEKIGMRLQNFFNRNSPDYSTWTIAYEDVSKIYMKIEASSRTIVQSLEITIESINNNMKKITNYIKLLDERLKKLENKIK
jgi:hypothetical protein